MGDRRWRRVAAGVALAVCLGAGSVGPADAQSVTHAELQALARRAVDDPQALAQLRAVQQVDGRPADVARALGDAQGPALASRLRTLAGGNGGAPPAVDASEVRQDAAAVLDGRRFKPPRVPRPFAGVLRTLGRWLQPVVDPFQDLWSRIRGNTAAELGLVSVAFAVAMWISARLVGRRSPHSVHRSRALPVDADGLNPDDLERQAAAAERAGDLDRAVRLRFVAGVLRLDDAGVIRYRSSLTTGQLRAALGSRSFAELAAAFDEIAYGGRPAEEADVRTAKAGWPQVVAESRR